MSREALAFILGRAALDEAYRRKINGNPRKWAKDMRLQLTPHEVKALKGIELKSLHEFHKAVRKQKIHSNFAL